ncbi:MAG: hypothetical protein RIS76_3878 [Verrucomicrobiota bacterium]|jgi:hypothetical protein
MYSADAGEDVHRIEAPKAVSGEAAIWTPKEMGALLAAAKPHRIPALAERSAGIPLGSLNRKSLSVGGRLRNRSHLQVAKGRL